MPSIHFEVDLKKLIGSNTWVAGEITDRVLRESSWQWGIG